MLRYIEIAQVKIPITIKAYICTYMYLVTRSKNYSMNCLGEVNTHTHTLHYILYYMYFV